MADYPEDLHYTEEHEWVRQCDGAVVRVGVTSFAADQLGDIVYVSLPTVGSEVVAGDACGELESTKSVSDLFSPVSGVVSAVNEAASTTPEIINGSPFEDGWLFEVEVADGADLDGLLDAAAYGEIATA